MNNETVGSRTGNNVGKVIVNVVDKNDQILTPPEEYQGIPGTAFYIDVPDLNGYIVQGLSGDSTTLGYLTNATFKKNVNYPANLGSVVSVSPNGTTAGTFGRGTLTYNLVYAPYIQAQSVNPAPGQQNQYQAAAAPRKKKHHWFRWTVIILLIIIILSVWGLYNAGKNAQQQVKQNPVVVKNYNTKPTNNDGNSNSSNGNSDNNSNLGNQQTQNAIDNAKQQIEQHIDQNNSNMLQQITAAIQDGFSMIAARIQAFFQGF